MLTRARVWNWVFLIPKSTIYQEVIQKGGELKKKKQLVDHRRLKFQERMNIWGILFALILKEEESIGFIEMFKTDLWLALS